MIDALTQPKPADPPTGMQLERVLARLEEVILGKRQTLRLTLACVLARGHLLVEDVPGVGKTTLSHALARTLGLAYRRIQFTSDLLPADILGASVYEPDARRFRFHPGPIFVQLVLADEINRATPKTQSALLEAMEEHQVTIDGDCYPLPAPFIVIATQNPQDFHGTYPLPESQLDRFMVRLHMGYPDQRVERDILRAGGGADPLGRLEPQLAIDELRALQDAVDAVRVDDLVLDYVMGLVEESRRTPQLELGVSTRGALALQRAARARALLLGRTYVLPDDIKALAVPVLAHRVHATGTAEGLLRAHDEAEQVIRQLVEQVPVPV